MASILSSRYQPSPRMSHYAGQVGEKSYVWGGLTQDLLQGGKDILRSTVYVFDHHLETWQEQCTSGVPPHGMHHGVYTSHENSLYSFAGYDGEYEQNSLHVLDTNMLVWRELRHPSKNGPMPKIGCGMVFFGSHYLATIGGHGIPTQPLQHGSTFIKNPDYTDGSGWTDEFHVFHITEGKWSSPPTTGQRPPPSSGFTFTAINKQQAVFFGGYQPGHGRTNEVYIIDFDSMGWTKPEQPEGAPWPVGRTHHAACCLNYGDDQPILLITGGVNQNRNTLKDAWLFHVYSGRWRELTLPEGTKPRQGHTLTSCRMGESRVHATTFGGCPSYDPYRSDDDDPKLDDTMVLEFESVQSGETPSSRQWDLVGVADSRQLGTPERTRELEKLKDWKTEHALQVHVESPNTVKTKQQEFPEKVGQSTQKRGATSDSRVHIQIQSIREQSLARERALQQRIQEVERRNRVLLSEAQQVQRESQSLQVQCDTTQQRADIAEQGRREAEEQLENLQQSLDEANARAADLQQRVQAAERRAEIAERRVEEAERRAEEAERRAEEAEMRAEKAERRAEEAGPEELEEPDPLWVVRRHEINLTDEELGRGGWAVVRVARFRKTHVAAKCLYGQIASNYNRLLFIREMNMAARVRHPNLLQFIGATLRGELIILTELMPTTVRRQLENEHMFSPNQINSISLDVARALNYLHLMHPTPIIHRDISSANVLLDPGPNNSWRAKVSDYGSVNLLERLRTAAPGNPTYAAPEVETATLQSPKMDIFSFGVLLVEMYTARFPEVADRQRLIRSIRHPSMVALIRRCLAEDRNARPSASGIITELSELNSP